MSKYDIVNNYFKILGVKEFNNFDDFIDYLEGKYDEKLFQDVINELIKRIDDKKNDFYSVKNSNLNLSLDFSSWSYDMYKKLFEELIEREMLLKDKVLDIGCDNGLITCFMAMLYKDKYFYGVDINENGIKVAIKLKEKLKLNNIEFYVLDINDLDIKFNEGYFDNIISVRVFHEVGNTFKKLGYVLNKDGNIIAFERLIDFNMLVKYVDKLYKSGLNLDINSSKIISFNELEDKLKLPFLVIDKSDLGRITLNELREFYKNKTQI